MPLNKEELRATARMMQKAVAVSEMSGVPIPVVITVLMAFGQLSKDEKEES
jgi:hypothetical protein